MTLQRTERTGFTTLLLRGWAVSYDAALRIRLTRGPLDTSWHSTEREACDRARELEKEGEK